MSESPSSDVVETAHRDPEAAISELESARQALNRGERQQALALLESAYASDPENVEVCFELAYQLDLVGEESEAMHLYEQVAALANPPLNALLNLAVMYEDKQQYQQAERCVRQVLATDPNHERARLFLKDVLASKAMVVDDEADKRTEKLHALLETPVTDFDLSLRSRNALRKMNVRTLGDLLRVTEAELRGFKNFGEASLEEIKSMLAQRGLKIGQAVEQQQSSAKQAVYDQLQQETGGDNEQLSRSVNELELSVRARKALALLNINTLGELCMRTEAELMGVKNFGMTSLMEIKEKLAQMGLGLRKLED